MSLQGLPFATPELRGFVQMAREYMRDLPEVNRIIAGEESSDRQIAWAVMDAISKFNGTPHFTQMSLVDLLGRNQTFLLLRLTVCNVIESVGLLQTRNHIDYATGGSRVAVNNKTPLLMEWLRYFRASADQELTRAKVAINIGDMLGNHPSGLHSEYWVANLFAGYR
jgi:hypothetical protein